MTKAFRGYLSSNSSKHDMLQAKNIKFTYLGSNRPALCKTDLTLHEGTIIQILGENGSGKTSLALVLSGAIPHLIHGLFGGQVTWKESTIQKVDLPRLSSFVFQDPYTYFAGHTVEEEKQFFGKLPVHLYELANSLFPDVPLDAPLHKLSSGEQQRIAIISAISRSNPLIILDEPFEFLDKKARGIAAKLFEEKAKKGSVVVVIDRPQNNKATVAYDKIIRMQNGQVFPNSIDETVSFPRIMLSQPSGRSILQVENLAFSYPLRPEFSIDDISLRLHEGESIGLVGPNGCGKTTLLLLLSGLLSPKRGVTSIAGEPQKGRLLRKKVKCAFQNPDTQLFGNTIREELEFGLRNEKLSEEEIGNSLNYAQEYLPFDIEDDPFSLSYGQKKLLGIVATFLMKPKVILLDEPTASLDNKNLSKVYNLIKDFLEQGGSLLISSHDGRVENMCHQILEMKNGKIVNKRNLFVEA